MEVVNKDTFEVYTDSINNRLTGIEHTLDKAVELLNNIHIQTTKTNGRVSQLEIVRDEFKPQFKTLLSDVSILKNEFSHHCDGNNTKIVTIESEVSSLKSGTWVFRWIATNQKLSLFILICVFVVIFGLDIGEILKKLKL